jgi:glycosyltransferase involved in cell wall biosynthesis
LRDLAWNSLCVGSTQRDPACTARIRADIRVLGLGRRVRLAGECKQTGLARHYAAASIFALPSRHEGYGMAFAEALAHGLPVAGARAGAVPLVVPARAGILVRAGDSVAFARALRRLLGPQRRRHARNAAALRFPDWRTQAVGLWAAVEALAA